MVDRAEQLLLDLGFHQVRVRIHGKIARIEIMPRHLRRFWRKMFGKPLIHSSSRSGLLM